MQINYGCDFSHLFSTDNTFTWKGQAVIVSSDIFFLSGVLAVKNIVRQESIQVILDEKVEVICGDRRHLSRSCSNEQSVAPFIRDTSTLSSRKNTCIKLDDLSVHVTTSDVGNGLVSGLRQKVAGYHSPVAFMSKKQLSNGCISARSRGKILVVNDSPISRKVLLRALEKSGFSADIACDGQVSKSYHFLTGCNRTAMCRKLVTRCLTRQTFTMQC